MFSLRTTKELEFEDLEQEKEYSGDEMPSLHEVSDLDDSDELDDEFSPNDEKFLTELFGGLNPQVLELQAKPRPPFRVKKSSQKMDRPV